MANLEQSYPTTRPPETVQVAGEEIHRQQKVRKHQTSSVKTAVFHLQKTPDR